MFEINITINRRNKRDSDCYGKPFDAAAGSLFKIIPLSNKVVISTIVVVIIFAAGIGYAALEKPYTFKRGDIISAKKLNENFDTLYEKIISLEEQLEKKETELKQYTDGKISQATNNLSETSTTINATISGLIYPPVGSIIAWHKNMGGVNAVLPAGWVECNGQTLADSTSTLNGQIIPNLNGNTSGANSPGLSRKDQMFLRGGTTSGVGQEHMFQDHTHSMGSQWHEYNWSSEGAGIVRGRQYYQPYSSLGVNSGNFGAETRPVNMSVVWIMRIK